MTSKSFYFLLIIFSSFNALAQEEAVTANGVTVLLYPDSTWKVKVEVVASEVASTGDSTQTDSLVVVAKPVKAKEYDETSTGFRGFLKPELKIAKLPEQSEGVYEFKVKVNKEGYVKEVVTMKRGINGNTEKMMRDAIIRMKFLPDGSIVPPLTEGIIRLAVTAQ